MHGYFIVKKSPCINILRQIKCITHDDFSMYSLNTKSFYHDLMCGIHSIQGELQEKEAQKDYCIQEICLERTYRYTVKRKLLILDLKPLRS